MEILKYSKHYFTNIKKQTKVKTRDAEILLLLSLPK